MKKFTPILLGLLLCVMCLSGTAMAAENDCTHENATNAGFQYYNNEWWHIVDCPDCGMSNHAAEGEYVSNDMDYHSVHCSECDMNWTDSHINSCSDSINISTCVFCGADIEEAYIEHNVKLINYDETYCYYSCDCGKISYEIYHEIYCNSEDKNTCAECGKNVERDGIIISNITHDTECGADEFYCWTICTACGYMPYFEEHYTGCDDDDDTRCDNCGRSEADGIQLIWKHTSLDHNTWADDNTGTLLHRQVCWHCGYEGKEHEIIDLTYIPINGNPNRHYESCSGCEFNWEGNHMTKCGDSTNTCIYCGAENVNITVHEDHPENSEIYFYNNAYGHRAYCRICGDDLGWYEHVADCSDPNHCIDCDADDVYISEVKHDVQLIDFDAEYCYHTCSCGEEADDGQHANYCDSEDPNTCVMCGKNTKADGIVIGSTWHHEHCEYDENECWNTCTNCGDLYRGKHYFSCNNPEQMYCNNCGASSDEVNIQVFKHNDIDFNDFGDGWHDPWCIYCEEHLGEPHEFSLSFSYGGYNNCQVYCDTCGYLGDWVHQGNQCSESNEHTVCIRCGAEDVRVTSYANHGPTTVKCVDEEQHLFYCSVCGEGQYSECHKRSIASEDDFGTCVICGAKDVLLNDTLTEEIRIENGIQIYITYNEDASKFIGYTDAESGEDLGWEWYEHWDDKDPSDWEHRYNLVYDTLNDRYTYDFDAPWGHGTKTRRMSDNQLIKETGYNVNSDYYEEILSEDDSIWTCKTFNDSEHTRTLYAYTRRSIDDKILCEQFFEYDARDISGSMLVYTMENGIEIAVEFYTSATDKEPSQWERYTDIVYETEELGVSGRVDIHRNFLTNEGDHGIAYFLIDDNNNWFLCYEKRYSEDDSSRTELIWHQEKNVYYRTVLKNDLKVYESCTTSDGDIISAKNWEYFEGIGPVVTEKLWQDDGTIYEKIYTNPNNSNTTYEERILVDENTVSSRSFTINEVTRVADQSILNMPQGIRTIESEAFANVSGWIVILHENVTYIADDAFSPDTVILVPNEEIAKLVQDAGYVWFFDR